MKIRYVPQKVDADKFGGVCEGGTFVIASLVHPSTGNKAGYVVHWDGDSITFRGAPWLFPVFKRVFKRAFDTSFVGFLQNDVNDWFMSGEPLWKRTASDATFNRYMRQYYKRQAQIEADAANGVTMIYG